MSTQILPVITPIPFGDADPEYLDLRRSILEDFGRKVPESLRLPHSIINKPPKDVSNIPRTCGILTEEELHITQDYDVTSLAKRIASKHFSAVTVVAAFAKRAIIAHQLTCCLTEWFMDEAIQEARALDEHLERTGQTVGPLHGIPVSIKLKVSVANHWSMSASLASRTKAEKDSQIVAILRQAGAVMYCKTTQPQSLMHLESLSIHGRTLNPYNIHLTSGGSSGGEGALIALRGSIMGVGTDIGGSIRCPAGFCGFYGFRPTSNTLPTKDFISGATGFAGELNVLGCTGPMCTSARDMDLFMNVVLSAKPYLEDPRLITIPWTGFRTTRSQQVPLRVGFMMNDGVISPQPPVLRALAWVRSQLNSSPSFQTKDFAPFQTKQAMDNIRLAYWPDGGRTLKEHLAVNKEPVFKLTSWAIKDADDTDVGVTGILQQRLDRDEFRYNFSKHWASQNVDIVICPVFVGPACSHDTAFYWNYTALWNYVDYPGLVVPTPIRGLKKGEEEYPAGSVPLSEECNHVRRLWAEGDFEGAPINVQVIARRHHDNELFATLGLLINALNLE